MSNAWDLAYSDVLRNYVDQDPKIEANGDGAPNQLTDELLAAYIGGQLFYPLSFEHGSGVNSANVGVSYDITAVIDKGSYPCEAYLVVIPPEEVIAPSTVLQLKGYEENCDGRINFVETLEDVFSVPGQWEVLYLMTDSQRYLAPPYQYYINVVDATP